MNGTVRCPSCGKDNESQLVEQYRMCSHCGAPIDPSMAGAAAAVAAPQPEQAQYAPDQAAAQAGYGAQPQYDQVPPGQTPPYGQQPYAQQPYGAPAYPGYAQPYPAPYPYPYPYGVPVAVSSHPGTYDRPEEAPRLNFGLLFKVLFKPKEAFEELYNHTTMTQGVILVILFAVLEGIIGLAITLTVLADVDEVVASSPFLPGATGAMAFATFGLGIGMSLGFFFLIGYLIHAFVKSGPTTLRPNLNKTYGLIGYGGIVGFVMGLITTPVSAAISLSTSFDDACLASLLTGILGLVSLIWSLWVYSHAVSVANDAPLGKSAVAVIVGAIVGGLIVVVIIVVIVVAALGMALGGV